MALLLLWYRTSEIYNCKLCIANLVTHFIFYRAAIVGIWVVTICYTVVSLVINSCTRYCYHLCWTHMEADFLTNKSHKCRLLNSLLPDDLIEALTCINLLPCIQQNPSYQHLWRESTTYCKRGSRITELEFTLFRTLWRD